MYYSFSPALTGWCCAGPSPHTSCASSLTPASRHITWTPRAQKYAPSSANYVRRRKKGRAPRQTRLMERLSTGKSSRTITECFTKRNEYVLKVFFYEFHFVIVIIALSIMHWILFCKVKAIFWHPF